MKLQTQIPLKKESKNQIDYQSNILLLGSCFSENIGDKLAHFKFKTVQNPFGILFHPKAIEALITNAINERKYTENDIFFANERWHSFDSHSSLSRTDKNELLQNLNTAIAQTNQQIKDATHIVITLGTSWIYRFIKTDSVVANCHKIPQKKFLKELLSVDEITESLEAITSLIKSKNKNVTVLFTVSPVRHLKDGFVENQQSKSHLITAIHNIVEPRKKTYYFPSYEIMMDELRDYRFYAEDMIHPNKIAINYIWEKFTNVWFSQNAKATMQEVAIIQNGLNHKAFNPNSEQHQQFLNGLKSKVKLLQEKHPFMKF